MRGPFLCVTSWAAASRRPWSVEESEACSVVIDSAGGTTCGGKVFSVQEQGRADGIGFIGFGEVSETDRFQAQRRKAPHWHKRPRNRNPRPRRWVLDRPLSSLDDGILANLFRHGGGNFRFAQCGVRVSVLARQRRDRQCRGKRAARVFFISRSRRWPPSAMA